MNTKNKIIEQSGEVLKETYNDLLKPTIEPIGQMISFLPRTVRLSLSKWEKWIINGEESLKLTGEAIREKIKNVSEEKLCEPENYVAIPAIQQISYCYDSEELRNLYANLLVSSMNSDKKWKVHPSFVDIIKQLTPDEAKLLKYLGSRIKIPAIDIHQIIDKESNAFVTVYKNYIDIQCGLIEVSENIPSYIDNLLRLNLIEIPNGIYIDDEKVYVDLEGKIVIKDISMDLIKFIKKEIVITSFGKDFIDVCVNDAYLL